MVFVKKQKNETTSNLLRRFSAKVKESGLMKTVKKAQFNWPEKSERAQRDSALWRERVRALRRKMMKLGEIGRGEKLDPMLIKRYLDKTKG